MIPVEAKTQLKIAIMGTGGVGGLFGARLAASGQDVSFIARGPHLKAIQAHGLKVVSEHRGDLTIKPARAFADAAEIGPVDYVFFCVKLWDTESAAQAIQPLIGDDTAVISFQNGISRDEVLRQSIGAKHVLGGISYVAATIEKPGVICQKGTVQKLVFGEYGQSRSERVNLLENACLKAEIEAEVPDDIEKSLWNKFLVLVAMSSLTASTRTSIGPVRDNPQTRALLEAVMNEVYSVGLRKGVHFDDDIVARQMGYLDGLAWDVSSSLQHDLSIGNRLELPWLGGTVVKLGAQLGVPTPILSVICALLDPFCQGPPQPVVSA